MKLSYVYESLVLKCLPLILLSINHSLQRIKTFEAHLVEQRVAVGER